MSLEYEPIKNAREIVLKAECYKHGIKAFENIFIGDENPEHEKLGFGTHKFEDENERLIFTFEEETFIFQTDMEKDSTGEAIGNAQIRVYNQEDINKDEKLDFYQNTIYVPNAGSCKVDNHNRMVLLFKYAIHKFSQFPEKLPFILIDDEGTF